MPCHAMPCVAVNIAGARSSAACSTRCLPNAWQITRRQPQSSVGVKTRKADKTDDTRTARIVRASPGGRLVFFVLKKKISLLTTTSHPIRSGSSRGVSIMGQVTACARATSRDT